MNETEPVIYSDAVRSAARAKLPDSWSDTEVDHFIATNYATFEKEGLFDGLVEAAPEMAPGTVVTEAEELAAAGTSRKGLTLDSYIIIDGRSIPLRAIRDAGQLVPFRHVIHEGSRKFPRRAVEYCARVVDRPMTLIITEETYKVLSNQYETITPMDEPLSNQAVANLQAKVSIVEADKLERSFKR